MDMSVCVYVSIWQVICKRVTVSRITLNVHGCAFAFSTSAGTSTAGSSATTCCFFGGRVGGLYEIFRHKCELHVGLFAQPA